MINIVVHRREKSGKCDLKRLRLAGAVPVVLYSKGKASELFSLDRVLWEKALRSIAPGHLPVSSFVLEGDGGGRVVLVKDLQLRPTDYAPLHIDLMELSKDPNDLICVKVPVICSGAENCVGIKAGGSLRLCMRHLKVRCKPELLPREIVVEIGHLDIRQSTRLSNLSLPEGVSFVLKGETVIAFIAKK